MHHKNLQVARTNPYRYMQESWYLQQTTIEGSLTQSLKGYSVILIISFYDMNQNIYKRNNNNNNLIPKFQLIPIIRLKVMHDYVCFIATVLN